MLHRLRTQARVMLEPVASADSHILSSQAFHSRQRSQWYLVDLPCLEEADADSLRPTRFG